MLGVRLGIGYLSGFNGSLLLLLVVLLTSFSEKLFLLHILLFVSESIVAPAVSVATTASSCA